MPGEAMRDAFNLLRPEDLIWRYVEERYLLGQAPKPFDLLYWNSDQTNLPGPLHLASLRRLYIDNALANGRFLIEGEPVDLSAIKIPAFIHAARKDHISPFASVYKGAHIFGGEVDFHPCGFRPHRRRREPARRQQVPLLDRRRSPADVGRLDEERNRTPRLVVAALGRMAEDPLRRGCRAARAHPRRSGGARRLRPRNAGKHRREASEVGARKSPQTSPAASSSPSARFRFCTAAPEAPLPRLSSSATSRTCPAASLPNTKRRRSLVPFSASGSSAAT